MEGMIFVPVSGGLGATLSCTGTSSNVAIPTPTSGSVYCVNNTGTDYVWLAFGDSSITATSSYMAFAPGVSYIGIPNAGSSGAPTYFAGITGGSTFVVQISKGNLVGIA